MSGELTFRHTNTGRTLYVTLRNAAQQYVAVAGSPLGLQSLVSANWANYAIPLVENPNNGHLYRGNWPAAAGIGWYAKDIFEQPGSTPSIDDTLLASIVSYWDGAGLSPVGLAPIADAVLSRAVVNVEATADPHSLCYVILAMSQWSTMAHAGKLTVYRSDGSTEFVEKTLHRKAGQHPIVAVT